MAQLNHHVAVEIADSRLRVGDLSLIIDKSGATQDQAAFQEHEKPQEDVESGSKGEKLRFTYSKAADDDQPDTEREGRALYQVHIILDKVRLEVNPRDTLAAHFVSERFAQILFNIALQNPGIGLLLFVSFVLAEVFVLLSIVYSPSFGWYTAIGFPTVLMFIALLHRGMLKALMKTFEWWGMLYFSVVYIAAAMDAVAFNPPRMVAFSLTWLSLLYTISMDARPLTKRKPSFIWRTNWWLSSSLNWTILILWWCEKWLDIRQTILPIGSVVTFDVQSIGFSSYFTLCIVLSKYALVLSFSKESNQCVILKPSLAYRYHSLEKDGGQVQAMV